MWRSKKPAPAADVPVKAGDRFTMTVKMSGGRVFTSSATISAEVDSAELYRIMIASRDGIRSAGFPAEIVVQAISEVRL